MEREVSGNDLRIGYLLFISSSDPGDPDPDIAAAAKSGGGQQAATYSFTINIDQVIRSSDAVLNPLQGQHVYFKWNVTERLDADEL